MLALPIAYYAMSKWLTSFAYKIELSWWIFVVAGFTALIIALVTVSWQTYTATKRNPILSLKCQ